MNSTRNALRFLALCLGMMLGCNEPPTSATDPVELQLVVVSGNSQEGTAFRELPMPLVVKVVNRWGRAARNQIVNFVVVEGGGSTFAGVAQTDWRGIAKEFWTLGAPGPQRLEVRAVNSRGEKLVFGTFEAMAAPGDPTLTVQGGGPGDGSVSSAPEGIHCTITGGTASGTCAFEVDHGTSATLTASPGSGMSFIGWSGGGCSGPAPCVVLMDQAQTVTATFAPTTNTITMQFVARVDAVQDFTGRLGGVIGIGNIITGTYKYDIDAVDESSISSFGSYRHTAAPYGITLEVAGVTIQTDPNDVDFLVQVSDSRGDAFTVTSRNNLKFNGVVTIDQITWRLFDPTGAALNNTDLVDTPPVLTDWQSNSLFISGGVPAEDDFSVGAHVTQIIRVP